jgi:hypothetical protein
MKYRSQVYLVFILLCTLACKNSDKEVIDKSTLKSDNVLSEKLLMHNVFLNLKDSVSSDEKQFAIDQLISLKQVEGVLELHAGPKAETGDERLNKNYDVALHVVFKSKEDLSVYDTDPYHAKVRAQLKDLLAGPPVVFDYWVE